MNFKYKVNMEVIMGKSSFLKTFRKATCYRLFSIVSNKNPGDFYERIKDHILHSSVLEEKFLKLGYSKNKSVSDQLRRQENKKKLDLAQCKPFPLGLSYLTNTGHVAVNRRGPNATSPTQTFKRTSYQDELLTQRDPEDWMHDYEFYDEQNKEYLISAGSKNAEYSVPCGGCGSFLHSKDVALPGYLPQEIFSGRTTEELKTMVCQRCHFLKTYNIAMDVTVSPEDYINMVSSIKDKFALAVVLVDVTDMNGSIWPGIQNILGKKRPIFLVGNKIDLLPKDSRGYLEHIKKCLLQSAVATGIGALNIKHTSLISAKTGYGIEELITKLHNVWGYNGDVYLVGCTNVGKSSLFNILLESDYCKVQAANLVQRATTCVWPGTTMRFLKFPILRPSDIRLYERAKRLFDERSQRQAERDLRKDQLRITGNMKHATLMGHIGRTFMKGEETFDHFSMTKGTQSIFTLNEKSQDFKLSKWCYDSPGVLHESQILSLLTIDELTLIAPKHMIIPRTYLLKPGMSLYIGGLGRLDYVTGNSNFIRVTVYASNSIPVLITLVENSEEVYNELLGTEILGFPFGNKERLEKWPKLERSDEISMSSVNAAVSICDIVLSSAGWVGINMMKGAYATFYAWTPQKRGIYVRQPSLIPFGHTLRGKRIRNSLAYRVGKPFIKQ